MSNPIITPDTAVTLKPVANIRDHPTPMVTTSYDTRLRRLKLKKKDLSLLLKLVTNPRVIFDTDEDLDMDGAALYNAIKHSDSPRLMIKIFKKLDIKGIVMIGMEPGIKRCLCRDIYNVVMTLDMTIDRFPTNKHMLVEALEYFKVLSMGNKEEFIKEQKRLLIEYKKKFMVQFPNFDESTLNNVPLDALRSIVDTKPPVNVTGTETDDVVHA